MSDEQRDVEQSDEQEPEVGRWRYVGGVERVYPHVPVTVQDGAVIEHVGPPAEDGCWEPADDGDGVTHRPDNAHPGEAVEGFAEESAPTDDPGDEQDDYDAEQQQIIHPGLGE